MNDDIQLHWPSAEALLPIVLEFKDKVKSDEELDLHEATSVIAQQFGIDDIDAVAEEQLHKTIQKGLGVGIDNESAKVIADVFSKASGPIMKSVLDYSWGKVKPEDLIESLESIRQANVADIQNTLQKTLGIPNDTANTLSKIFGGYLVSIYCLAATYKIYQKAAQDAEIAKEHRIEMERLSHETVVELKSQRLKMEKMVNTYLINRLLPFDAGINAMDQAIAESDNDGFVRANAELWKLFGRDAQYTSAAEFDDLMASSETFRL